MTATRTHVFTRDFRVADSRGERVYFAGTEIFYTPLAAWWDLAVEQGAIVPLAAAPPPAVETSGSAPAAVPLRRDGESDLQFAQRLSAHMRQGSGVGLPRRRDGESELQFAERLAARIRQVSGAPAGDLGDQVVALLRQRPAGAELVRP
jgi:hypothetical protein